MFWAKKWEYYGKSDDKAMTDGFQCRPPAISGCQRPVIDSLQFGLAIGASDIGILRAGRRRS
jgi:hypothetical protein